MCTPSADKEAASEDDLRLAHILGRDVWTIPEILQARYELSPSAHALWSLDSAGVWQPTTWAELSQLVVDAAHALHSLGLRPGDRVGIVAPSSRHWDIVHLGVLAVGGVVVGIDPHDLGEQAREIALRCNLTGVAVQEPGMLDRLGSEVRARLKFVVSIDPTTVAGIETLRETCYTGNTETLGELRPPKPDDPATILFTSGTTAGPKGIQYTHRQVALAVAAILNAFPDIREGSRLACWLPLSGIFQRMLNICAIARGAETYYVENPQEIMRHVKVIEPHLFIGVPRFYEKLYAGIMEQIQRGPAWQQRLAMWALGAGARYQSEFRAGLHPGIGTRLVHRLADQVILKRLRGIMGANLRYMVSGSAPMPRWLLDRFQDMGLLVLEGYALSENVIPVAANRPRSYRLGSVGRPMPGSEVRLAEDGELCVRGPGVFGGYFAENGLKPGIDADGYLATGDYASIDADGFITLTGRKSEIFKTSTGRRVAPAPVEAALRAIPYVEYAVLVGAGRPFPVVLLAVSEARLRAGCGASPAISIIGLSKYIRVDLMRAVGDLPDYQRPAGAVITTEMFSIQGGELTPNLKLRRKNIETVYGAVLGKLYQSLKGVEGTALEQELSAGKVLLCSL